ncbi:MAG: 4Fe-4S dicluster domain-containing protein [Anaerolineaceae bacterium]|nr:4Fe-4S dicluster domain-containing protein [Anaerolineaceae bacterium]
MSKIIRIKVNKKVCSGCLSCVTTCSMVHEHYASLAAGRVQVELKPFGGFHEINICRQCAKHPCLIACPQGAIYRDEADVVRIDYEKCNNCRVCIDACPFNAMFWNPIEEQVIKCDLCDGNPQCVEACPTGALTIREITPK